MDLENSRPKKNVKLRDINLFLRAMESDGSSLEEKEGASNFLIATIDSSEQLTNRMNRILSKVKLDSKLIDIALLTEGHKIEIPSEQVEGEIFFDGKEVNYAVKDMDYYFRNVLGVTKDLFYLPVIKLYFYFNYMDILIAADINQGAQQLDLNR